MVSLLTFGLRDMRDRAILLLGYAAGLRRSAIVGLDVNRDDTEDGKGWIETEDGGAVIIQRTKTGWNETGGAPVCSCCDSLDAYSIPTRRKFQCKA